MIMATKAAENGVARSKRPRPYRTRSSANEEGPREHTVSWNHVKFSTNVRRIASEKAYDQQMTFKVIQGYCRCCHLIGHIRFLLVSHCKYISILHRFRDINTYLPKIKTARDLDHAHLGQFVIAGLLRAGGKTPVPLVGKHGASQLYWGGGSNSLAPALSVCGHLTSEKRNRLSRN